MSARAMALVAVVAVGLAGCTDPPSDRPSSSSAPPPVVQERPKDRDEEAVLTALNRLDLCAMAAAAAAPGLLAGARPRARQPMACELGEAPDSVDVTVVPLGHAERVSLPTQVVGGAKAYVDEERSRCVGYLPISFELAVAFAHRGSCRVVTELAAASASVLADPEAARVDPRWDPCSLLAEGLDRAKLFVGTDLGTCQYLGVPTEEEAMLSFSESVPPPGQPRAETVAGTRVQIYEDGDNCGVYWRQRPFTSRFALAPDYPVLVFSVDCAYSTELAESAIEALAEPAPVGGTPQHPLLYAPDEPDGPFIGDCAFVEDESAAKDCEPYHEVPIPDDPTDAHNAQVMCALSADAVRKHFGERLRPVAVSDSGDVCHFVEPERTTVLTFTAGRGRPTGGQAVTIAAHPGLVTSEADGSSRYQVSTDGDGKLELTVGAGPLGDQPPAGAGEKAEAVLADVLRTHFS